MKRLLLLFIAFSTIIILAEVKINKPLLRLIDENGVKVATDSTSIEKAMEKASSLPEGIYTLERPNVTITVKPNNVHPIANAGEDITVNEGELVILDASNSFDTDGEIVNYKWTQTSGPPVELIPMGDGQFAFRVLNNNTVASNN